MRRKEGGLPWFTTTATADVDVDIDPEELIEAGWVYQGPGGLSVDRLERLVREVHDDEHEGPLRWCVHPLCREVVGE